MEQAYHTGNGDGTSTIGGVGGGCDSQGQPYKPTRIGQTETYYQSWRFVEQRAGDTACAVSADRLDGRTSTQRRSDPCDYQSCKQEGTLHGTNLVAYTLPKGEGTATLDYFGTKVQSFCRTHCPNGVRVTPAARFDHTESDVSQESCICNSRTGQGDKSEGR